MDLVERNEKLEAQSRDRTMEQIKHMMNSFAEQVTEWIGPTTRHAFISQNSGDNEPLIKIWEPDGIHDLETLAVFSLRKELIDAVDTDDERLVSNIRAICDEVIGIIDRKEVQ